MCKLPRAAANRLLWVWLENELQSGDGPPTSPLYLSIRQLHTSAPAAGIITIQSHNTLLLCCCRVIAQRAELLMHRKHPGECLEWMKYVWKIWVIILTKLLSLCSICCGGRGGRVTHRHSNISTTWLQWGVTVHRVALYGCTQCASGVLPSVMTLTMSASNYPQPARGSPTKLSCNLPL